MPKRKKETRIEKITRGADKATRWIGSTKSLIVHTIIFSIVLILPFFGVKLDMVLLVLTTFLSLEAIYLAIFIQMTVNKNTKDIEEIQEDVEEIQEDVEEIQEDVDEIQEDVDEIQEDVDEIQKDVDEIQEDIEEDVEEDQTQESKDNDALAAIQSTLAKLSQEIEQIKKK